MPRVKQMQRLPPTFTQPRSFHQQDIQIRRELSPTFTGSAVICIVLVRRGVDGIQAGGEPAKHWLRARVLGKRSLWQPKSLCKKKGDSPSVLAQYDSLRLYEFADRLQKFNPEQSPRRAPGFAGSRFGKQPAHSQDQDGSERTPDHKAFTFRGGNFFMVFGL